MIKGIQIFNKYLHYGGEESSVDRIFGHLNDDLEMRRCFFDSADWKGEKAPSLFSQVRNMFYNKDSFSKLSQSLENVNPNFVIYHNTLPVASPSVYQAAFDKGVPTIQYIHNFRPFSVGGGLWVNGKICRDGLKHRHWAEMLSGTWQDSKLKSIFMGLVLRSMQKKKVNQRISHWIAISDCIRNAFIEAGVDPNKITTIRHSWDAMNNVPVHVDEGYYVVFTRLIPEKGISELLAAWNLIQQEAAGNTPRLVIAGDGALKCKVEQASESNPLIEYVGYVDGEKKRDLLSKCRCVLAPSVWLEPLGLASFEAYDNGKPVIASKNGGLNETVFHNESGLHLCEVTPLEIQRQVMKMERFSEDKRREMGRVGREWLLTEASPERWKQKFNEVLKKIC